MNWPQRVAWSPTHPSLEEHGADRSVEQSKERPNQTSDTATQARTMQRVQCGLHSQAWLLQDLLSPYTFHSYPSGKGVPRPPPPPTRYRGGSRGVGASTMAWHGFEGSQESSTWPTRWPKILRGHPKC
eukprot:3461946-Pyramimonas_sp.AAC.2